MEDEGPEFPPDGGDELDGDEGGDEPWWESSARSKIRAILDTAEFDAEVGAISLWSDEWDPRGKGDSANRVFHDLDELRTELVGLGDAEITARVPWEGGPVFSTDSDDIVDDELDQYGVYQFFRTLEVPDGADLLLSADDLLEADPAGQIRLDFEAVNDLLITHLAQHPELMRDVHPRRFEEIVAELFRRMGYEVILTPRTKDGGFDVLAFQKTGIGKLLTLVECKRFRPDRKIGVGLVRTLYGVVEERRASHGVIATTSSFTRDARAFQQNLEHRLSLSDFNDLSEWLARLKQ